MPLDFALPATAVSSSGESRVKTGDRLAAAVNSLAKCVPRDRFVVGVEAISIPVRSPQEFNIGIIPSTRGWIVTFDGWHDEFQDLDSVLKLISQALLGQLRLRVDKIAGRPYCWTVERALGGAGWTEIYASGFFVFRCGRKTDSFYLVLDQQPG